MEAGPDRIAEMLESIVEGFASGRLRPLPVRAFPITEAEAAFRFMAQAQHVGKLVLVPPRELRTDGTVLVTGGLGALGLHVARWLVGRGVKHLVLTGRRGKRDAGSARRWWRSSRRGEREVTVAAVDVADRAALGAVLSSDSGGASAAGCGACGGSAGRRDAARSRRRSDCAGDVAEGGGGVSSRRADARDGPRLLRAVLVGVGHAGVGGTGCVRGGEHVLGCAGGAAACAGAARAEPGVGLWTDAEGRAAGSPQAWTGRNRRARHRAVWRR